MRSKKRGTRGSDSYYEVGYCRPPRQHQFKKGQPSPNPKGRPRGSKTIDLHSVLKETVLIKIGGRTQRVHFLAAYVQSLKDRAMNDGDLRAGQLLLNVAKQCKMLEGPDLEDDVEFTIKIGNKPLRLSDESGGDEQKCTDEGHAADED
jgi:hypothetical protein